jgi:hypothetical protein
MKQAIIAAGAALLLAPAAQAGVPPGPTADAGGPYAVQIGDDITLDGSGSFGFSIDSYDWDLDFDGAFDDAAGVTVTLLGGSNYGGFFGSPSPNDVFDIGLEVTDLDGFPTTDTDFATITFAPEPSTLLLLSSALAALVARSRLRPKPTGQP